MDNQANLSGKNYRNVDISGNARVHLGNVYYLDDCGLKYVQGATYDAKGQASRACHPETRKDLLADVRAWAQQLDKARIFWLQGMAGTGKSTISYTVARWLDEQSSNARLGASFFFKRGERDRASAMLFFPTIVRQLSLKVPELGARIRDSVAIDPDICSKSLGEQFKNLLLRPLQNLHAQQNPPSFIILIDALDECEDDEDKLTLLQLLRSLEQIHTVHMRVFLTSRPDLPLRLGFAQMTAEAYEDLILHELSPDVVRNDISYFLRDELVDLRNRHNLLSTQKTKLPATWPGNDVLVTLSEMVSPLFIAAATVCLFLKDSKFHPQERLEKLLQENTSRPFSKLGQMYQSIVLQSFDPVSDDDDDQKLIREQFKLVVGSILNMKDPLPIEDLATLLDIEAHVVELRLRPLHSVIWVPSDYTMPIRPLHLSFGEYLCSESLKTDFFHIGRAEAHHVLLTKCFRLLDMPQGLRENLVDLSYPGYLREEIDPSLVEQALPPAVQYSCRYWVHHAVHRNVTLLDDGDVHNFLKHHFLHWLEALSLLKILGDALLHIQSLKSIITDTDHTSSISTYLDDARRFVLTNRHRIAVAPLQVYSSAILFTSEHNNVRVNHGRKPSWVTVPPQPSQSYEVQRLDGHTDRVSRVVFSPDGSILASASADCTVRLWDPQTGQILNVLEGHTDSVTRLAFFPDGTLLASASIDLTIRVWNVRTGRQFSLQEIYDFVKDIRFLSHDYILVSASAGGTIRRWSVTKNQELLVEHVSKGDFNAVQLSPDRKKFAGAWSDVCLWSSTSGMSWIVLDKMTRITCLAFSPCGNFLASGSYDAIVRVFDVNRRRLISLLSGHLEHVLTLAFSPNSHILVSGSEDETLHVWDPHIGTLKYVLRGHTGPVCHLSFPHEGSRLVSGAGDSTLRLWDPWTGDELGVFVGHVGSIACMASSPTKPILVSCASEAILQWDTAMDYGIQQSELVGREVRACCLSSDGPILASAFSDGYIDVQNMYDWKRLDCSGFYGRSVTVLEFHPYSLQFALGRTDGRVELWDFDRTERVWDWNDRDMAIVKLLFSPNGSVLASIDSDADLRLYDLVTGLKLDVPDLHSLCYDSVAFSTNSTLVAAASPLYSIRIWSTCTRELVWELRELGNTPSITVAFSDDNARLVSTYQSSLKIWCLKTGRQIGSQYLEQRVKRLRYITDNAILTERGWVSLGDKTSSSIELCTLSGVNWVVEKEWLTYRGQKFLWLPEEYRAMNICVDGNNVVMRHPSGMWSAMTLQDPY